MSHRRARTFPRAAKMAAFPVRSGLETSRHASARVLWRRRRAAAALYHKLLEAQRDWENGRKNFHEHTDEEVERLIAQAGKTNKRQKNKATRPPRKGRQIYRPKDCKTTCPSI